MLRTERRQTLEVALLSLSDDAASYELSRGWMGLEVLTCKEGEEDRSVDGVRL